MGNYICKNNKEHGILRPSQWNTPRSSFKTFVCDICKESWDEVKDLQNISLNTSNNKYHTSLLKDINHTLKSKIQFHVRSSLPFNFEVREENNSMFLKTYDIVNGLAVPKNKVHSFTKNILQRVVEEVEKKYSVTISWSS